MLDPTTIRDREAHRAAPTHAALTAALRELRDTGRFHYESTGERQVLEATAQLALDELEGAMAEMPALRRFLGVMLIARESRLAGDRRRDAARRRGPRAV
jgi:hypothetical protein